jgi:Ser/Thr protein kinase RdoA (MazF antagonist)
VHERFAPHLGLSAPRPIACYPELLALVTERVEGVSLQELLARARAFPSRAAVDDLSLTVRRVGAWIKEFQAFDGPAGNISLDEMRSYLDKRLQPLADGYVIGADVRLGLLRHFDELAGRVSASDLETVPIHADFTPENVLIHNGDVSVLDFTMAKRGAQYLDLSHMLLHLDLLKAKPWFRPTVVETLITALVAGFDPTLRTDHPLFQLLLLQHVVCHLRQMQLEPLALRARVSSEFLRRRHRAWLTARGATPSRSR